MEIKDKIIQEMKGNKNGYTISELSRKLKISRNTIAISFAYLEGKGNLSIRAAGMAKIYYWVGDKK